MDSNELPDDRRTTDDPPAEVAEPQGTPPWEEIEAGRFQPRRIRGSCRGRVLG